MSRGLWLGWVAGLGLTAGLLAGCLESPGFRAMMQSPDARTRAQGCKRAGDEREKSAIPLLVDRLEDPDRAVRFYAGWSLRVITGKDFQYRESDPPDRRAAAITRWRQYAKQVSGGVPAGGGAP